MSQAGGGLSGEQGQHHQGLEMVGEEGRGQQMPGHGAWAREGACVNCVGEGQWGGGLLETGWRPGAHPPPAYRAGLRGVAWEQGQGGDPQPGCWVVPVRGRCRP